MTEHFAFEESLGYTTQIYLDKTVFASCTIPMYLLNVSYLFRFLPLSISVTLVCATRFTTSRTSFIALLFPIINERSKFAEGSAEEVGIETDDVDDAEFKGSILLQ